MKLPKVTKVSPIKPALPMSKVSIPKSSSAAKKQQKMPKMMKPGKEPPSLVAMIMKMKGMAPKGNVLPEPKTPVSKAFKVAKRSKLAPLK